MKFLGISTLVSLPGLAISFTSTTTTQRTPTTFFRNTISSLSANVLEGKEIENDFTPINNMHLVRKGEIVDQTEGGIFLTGKVREKRLFLDIDSFIFFLFFLRMIFALSFIDIF